MYVIKTINYITNKNANELDEMTSRMDTIFSCTLETDHHIKKEWREVLHHGKTVLLQLSKERHS